MAFASFARARTFGKRYFFKCSATELFVKARVGNILKNSIMSNIRNLEKLQRHFQVIDPDVVIYLAAQTLVHESYKDSLNTFDTNVNRTMNVLRSSQTLSELQARLIITTDKVYRNVNKSNGYHEADPLGGGEPYSASKAMADIATQSQISSFENAPTAIARAGNVIVGGDVCADRLIPDLVKSYTAGQTPLLRAPNSVRPWQHVQDCLNGYLVLVDALIGGKREGAWNFDKAIEQPITPAPMTIALLTQEL